MPESNFIFYDEKDEIKPKVKKPKVKKPTPIEKEPEIVSEIKKPEPKKPEPSARLEKNDSHLFGLAVVTIIILGVIGLVFGYTKDKISELTKGGQDISSGLTQQVTDLKNQLTTLQQKADTLQQASDADTSAVLDLFEKNRALPEAVDTNGWSLLSSPSLSFTVSYPKTWQASLPQTVAEDNSTKVKQEMVKLEPINQPNFAGAVTIQTAYPQYAKLSMKEKLSAFKALNLIDEQEYGTVTMLYYININSSKQEVPTILVLTDNNIYAASFNVADKRVSGYLGYRKDFEQIAVTFALAKKK
ncbi:MAG: hypothetical protein V1763_01820 [Parcubacteria group bacterium]